MNTKEIYLDKKIIWNLIKDKIKPLNLKIEKVSLKIEN